MKRLSKAALAELQSLETKTGRLYPAKVVNAARDARSPLHGYFTWNNTQAAEKYRITEAQEIIRRVKIEITVDEKKVRVVRYTSIAEKQKTAQEYRVLKKQPIKEVLELELERICGNIERTIAICASRPGKKTNTVGKYLQSVNKKLVIIL